MDGLTNVVNQQQAQTTSISSQEQESEKVQETQPTKRDLIKESQEESKNPKINSKEDVENLVKELNDAMSPMETNLKFGVDKNDIYFVSVIDQKTNDIIRRFPAEKAMDFLPKMQEVSGMLFDSKI